MTAPRYDELRRPRDAGRPRGTGGKAMLSGKRAWENQRRDHAARARAQRALTWAYPDVFSEFFDAARAEIDAERGPLPASPVGGER